MALSNRDRARLGRIEAELARADPGLVHTFRQWWAPGRDAGTPPGWCTVPVWTAAVFLVAFCTWTVAPFVGWLAAVVAAVCWLRERHARRDRARSRADGDTGWWFRPIDRW